MKLSYFLIKDGVGAFEDALDPKKLEGVSPFEVLPFSGTPPFDGVVYFQFNRETPPKWKAFLTGGVDFGEREPVNQTNAAIVLLRVDGRIFAVSLGFGYHALDDDQIERDFGFVCSLNATDKKSLRSVDSRNIDFVTKLTRTYTSQAAGFAEFGFDEFGDVLHKVSGTPTDPSLGKALSGADAASLNADVEFAALGDKCSELLRVYRDPDDV